MYMYDLLGFSGNGGIFKKISKYHEFINMNKHLPAAGTLQDVSLHVK